MNEVTSVQVVEITGRDPALTERALHVTTSTGAELWFWIGLVIDNDEGLRQAVAAVIRDVNSRQ